MDRHVPLDLRAAHAAPRGMGGLRSELQHLRRRAGAARGEARHGAAQRIAEAVEPEGRARRDLRGEEPARDSGRVRGPGGRRVQPHRRRRLSGVRCGAARAERSRLRRPAGAAGGAVRGPATHPATLP